MNKSTTAIKIFISSDFLSILYWKIVKHYLYYCFFFHLSYRIQLKIQYFFRQIFFIKSSFRRQILLEVDFYTNEFSEMELSE